MHSSSRSQRGLRCAALFAALAWLLNSCADIIPDDSNSDAAHEDSLPAPNQPPNASNREPLAAFDELIPLTASDSFWYLKDDLESLSDTSAVGFVGRITGYVERIKTIPYSKDTPAEDRGYDVYDGVMFTVDELLTGEIKSGNGTVTVALRTLVLNPDATPRSRIWEDPMELIRSGIEGRYSQDRPSFLVYVTEDTEAHSPFYNSGYYFFNTPGGVAPMLDGDRIGYALDRPLARPVVAEDGVYRQIDHGLTLDDARAVGRVVENDNTPASDGDTPDPFGDLTPGEPGPVGVPNG